MHTKDSTCLLQDLTLFLQTWLNCTCLHFQCKLHLKVLDLNTNCWALLGWGQPLVLVIMVLVKLPFVGLLLMLYVVGTGRGFEVFSIRFGLLSLFQGLEAHRRDTGLWTGMSRLILAGLVMAVSTSTWGPRVRSDRGKSWEPAHCCTVTCDCSCLVIFRTFLGHSITSSCSTWFIVHLQVLPS